MKSQSLILLVFGLLFFPAGSTNGQSASAVPDRWNYPLELHESVQANNRIPVGPFVHLGNGRILSVSPQEAWISDDQGESWVARPIFANPDDFEMPARAVGRSKAGVVVVAFYNLKERHWTWSDELQDAPEARLPTYVVRSLDDGETWEPPIKLHDDWTGSVRDMIITQDDKFVFTTMMMRHNPGRHTVLTYMSDDQGETWQRSNVIDLGGVGNHGGVTEATLEELKDGTLMKLIRTNWMQFWRAESRDAGRTWHPIGPSGIPASSAPANLRRLASGRLLLVWNQPYPEGQTSYPMRGGDGIWSAVPVSNHRGQLSLAFSQDDGQSWSSPVVIARSPKGREVAYPFVFEPRPGVIWVTTARGPLRGEFLESSFVDPVQE